MAGLTFTRCMRSILLGTGSWYDICSIKHTCPCKHRPCTSLFLTGSNIVTAIPTTANTLCWFNNYNFNILDSKIKEDQKFHLNYRTVPSVIVAHTWMHNLISSDIYWDDCTVTVYMYVHGDMCHLHCRLHITHMYICSPKSV